jgi:hypothetical protein
VKPGRTNIVASVQERLRNVSRSRGRPYHEILSYYAMERLLYRISRSRWADQLVLKGALMFAVWGMPGQRTTRDIDFLGRISNNPEDIAEAFRGMLDTEVPEDGMRFDPDSVRVVEIRKNATYRGARVMLMGRLGLMRLPMQIDIGFGDAAQPPPEPISYPCLLEFPPPRLQGYRRETTIAEKYHAMVELATLNSRMKDFHDIIHLARHFDFDGVVLVEAVAATFASNRSVLTRPAREFFEALQGDAGLQVRWSAFLRKSLLEGDPGFAGVCGEVWGFLGPVHDAIAGMGPRPLRWRPGGPWDFAGI